MAIGSARLTDASKAATDERQKQVPEDQCLTSRKGDNPIVTSQDVARAANVSQSTVSLVLNGKADGRVAEATRKAVMEAAARLGYAPNTSARMLRTGTGRTLALAVPNVQQPYFGQVLLAAEGVARAEGYAVLLVDSTSDDGWSDRLVALVRSRTIAGCIAYAPDPRAEGNLQTIADRTVMIESDTAGLSDVDLDIEDAMRQVVQHLIGLGHSRIGHLAAVYGRQTFRRRHLALAAELAATGISLLPEWHVSSDFEIEAATLAARTLIGTGVTAIACDDDLLAGAVYRAARQLGLAIPKQLSVVGFNDVELARMLDPELTTVRIPAESVGQAAMLALLGKLGADRERSSAIVIEMELVVRDSTSAALPQANDRLTM